VSQSDKPNDDTAARELEEAHEHADPSRGDKKTKDGEYVSTKNSEPNANPGN